MPLKDPIARREYLRKRQLVRMRWGYVSPCVGLAMDRTNIIKVNTPCADCKDYFPPVCMDFDHIGASGTKVDAVSRMVAAGKPWPMIAAEIAKCEVVCACCHRIRTQLRKLESRKQY